MEIKIEFSIEDVEKMLAQEAEDIINVYGRPTDKHMVCTFDSLYRKFKCKFVDNEPEVIEDAPAIIIPELHNLLSKPSILEEKTQEQTNVTDTKDNL